MDVWLIAAGVVLLSAALTRALVNIAPRLGLIDAPNKRSSHTKVTPRGGGLAIAFVWSLVVAILNRWVWGSDSRVEWLLVAALGVALIGAIDDCRGVSPFVRASVHVLAASAFVYALSGEIVTGVALLDREPWLLTALSVLALVWAVNLFNFMDGIDGLAGGQAAFMAAVLSGLFAAVEASQFAGTAALLSASAIGFLVWNWAPARIFMGDVGSGFLGFVLAALSLLAMSEAGASLWVIVLLWALFLVDATVTLLVRAMLRQNVFAAHRSHAYQIIARRVGSHAVVSACYLGFNCMFLLPLVVGFKLLPVIEVAVTTGVLLMLSCVAVWVGAGRNENYSHRH